MRRLAILLGVVGTAVLAAACGSSNKGGGAAPVDSGMDSTTESGTSAPEAGSDSTAQDAPSEISMSDAGDGGGVSEAGAAEGGPSCMAFDAGILDDAAVAAGLAFIQSAGHCNHCHQSNPDAGILLSGNNNSITDAGPVYPPNLTPDPATGLGCWTNDQIANAILFGRDPTMDGGLLCGLMPKFGVPKGDAAAPLNDASVYNVVDFLRSLAPVSNQVPQTMCPAMAATGSADAGDAGDGGTADAGDAGSADVGDAATE
jgi:hypothetical protein